MLIMPLSATLWKRSHVETEAKFDEDKHEKLESFLVHNASVVDIDNNFCAYGLKHFEYIHCMNTAKPVIQSCCHLGKRLRKINTARQKREEKASEYWDPNQKPRCVGFFSLFSVMHTA